MHVHATFLVLVGYVALAAYGHRRLWDDAARSVLFILVFFGVVVLHELGHCLTARRFGIATQDITLLPIGGLARLARLPEKPSQELLIALAGPLVNVVLGVILYAFVRDQDPRRLLGGVRLVGGDLWTNLFAANAMMAVFNLMPAFPMDGGRVLRALLALRLDYRRATDLAATTGQALAWAFGAIGLVKNPWLLIIAIFVFLGAEAEADFVKTKSVLANVRIQDVMVREFHALGVRDPLSRAIQHIMAGFQEDFPVVEGDKVVGILTRKRLLEGLGRDGAVGEVGTHMVRDFRTAFLWETTSEAFQRLQDCDCRAMPVLNEGRLVGMLTAENLGEYVMIQAALKGEPVRRPLW